MTPPLLVDSLSLRAFRGVRDELGPLDLTSPITLIYAPNGTGKTSLIDAAEWLLTGNVYRLNELSDEKRSKIKPNELRCQTSHSDVEQCVWGSVQMGGTPKLLIRDEEGWTGDGSTIKEPELLKLFAPNAVGENVPHQSAPRLRRNWVRGARFLTEATLATLVDTDKDSEDARQEIMADMLGVREINERAEKFEKYAEVLRGGYRAQNHPAVPGISSLEKTLKDKILALKELGDGSSAKPSESAAEVVEIELDNAIIALKNTGADMAPLSPDGTEKIIAQISARHSSESEKLEVQKESLNSVLATWMEIDGFRVELIKKQKEQKNLNKEVSELENTIPEMKAQVVAEKQAIEQANDKKKSVFSAHESFKNSLKSLTNAIGKLESADIPAHSGGSINDLEALPEAAWDESSFDVFAYTTSGLSDDLDSVDSELQWLSSARSELSALTGTALDQKALIALKNDVELHEKKFNELSSTHAEQSGPVEDLRLAVSRFLNTDAEGSSCPACGHQWENKATLDEALERAASQVPKHMQSLSDELLKAELRLKDAKSTLAKAESVSQSITLKAEEIKAKEKAVEGFFERLQELSTSWGWKNPAPNKSEISKHLERIGNRISFGNTLIEFLADLQELTQSLGNTEVPSQSVSSLDSHYGLLISQLGQATDDVIKKKNDELSKINSELNLKNTELEQKNSLLVSVRNRVGELVPLVENFASAWENIGGAETKTDLELTAIKDRIEALGSALAQTHQHLSAAKAAHESIAAEKRATEIRFEINALREKIKYLDRKRNLATKAAKELENFSSGYIHRQFDKLSKVFWPIFWRLQANEFYESIEPGPPKAPLRWEAKAMGKTFNPTMHFSMGQRQDFALAVFLTRARSLGGTFFLDEPIIHLDDLNRVALLDLFRLMAIEPESQSKFVITTASKSLVRHMIEKCASVPRQDGNKTLRVYELGGNPRAGINLREI